MKKLKTLFFAIAVISLLSIVGCSGNSIEESSGTANSEADKESVEPKTLKIAFSASEAAVPEVFEFEKEVEENSGGSINVEIYPNGQLGGDIQTIEGLRAGTIQGGIMAPSPLATLDPGFNIFDIPFLYENKEDVYKIQDGPVGQELLDGLAEVGIVGLGYGDVGFRHLTNSKREVTSPEDLEGLKIRTMENPLHVELWNSLGANPTAIAFPELYSALEQHVVDGQENPFVAITATKLYEVQKYVTKTGHVYMGTVYMVSQSFWDSLTDKEKEVIQTAIDNMVSFTRENAAKLEAESEEIMKEAGLVITELTPEQRQKFVEIAKPVHEKYKEKVGEELFNKVIETLK